MARSDGRLARRTHRPRILGVAVAAATIVLFMPGEVTATGLLDPPDDTLAATGDAPTSVGTAGPETGAKKAPASKARIAYNYSSPNRGSEEIFVINSDGANLQQLTYSGQRIGNPVWSPDGTRIAYTQSDADGRGDGDISVMNADGTNHQRVSSWGGRDPAWSRDATRIAYSGYWNGNIYVG